MLFVCCVYIYRATTIIIVENADSYKKQIFRTQFFSLGGRPVLTKTYVDKPAGVTYGQKFAINGIQFLGWYVMVMPPQSPSNMSDVTLRVFNEKNEAVTDIQ
jgi:hypothetical protein